MWWSTRECFLNLKRARYRDIDKKRLLKKQISVFRSIRRLKYSTSASSEHKSYIEICSSSSTHVLERLLWAAPASAHTYSKGYCELLTLQQNEQINCIMLHSRKTQVAQRDWCWLQTMVVDGASEQELLERVRKRLDALERSYTERYSSSENK